MKKNSQWMVIKVEDKGISTYSVVKGNKKLSIAGNDKFINAIPFTGGVAVALENRTKKDINIQWYIFDENGYLTKTCKTLRCVMEHVNTLNNENSLEI